MENKVKLVKQKRRKNNKKKIVWLSILLVILLLILFGILFTRNNDENSVDENIKFPVIDLNGKEPEELTWEEYMELSEEEQAMFPDYFESYDDFKEWYEDKAVEAEEAIEDVFTIDLNGKEPEELTWEEYMELSEEEQAMFPDYFESYDEFQEWMKNNKPED